MEQVDDIRRRSRRSYDSFFLQLNRCGTRPMDYSRGTWKQLPADEVNTRLVSKNSARLITRQCRGWGWVRRLSIQEAKVSTTAIKQWEAAEREMAVDGTYAFWAVSDGHPLHLRHDRIYLRKQLAANPELNMDLQACQSSRHRQLLSSSMGRYNPRKGKAITSPDDSMSL